MAELKRTLGVGAAIFFGVGSILGAGIYTIIGKVAGFSGNMLWLSFLIASITAICTVFSYSELSAAYPKSGGEYEYARKAFGKNTGLFLGIVISLNGIVSGATVATGFAGYLAELIQVDFLIGSLGIITLLFIVNISGIRESSVVNIIFTVIEAAGLLYIIYLASGSVGKVDLLDLPPDGINGLLMASALAFYAYIGFEEIVKLAEETNDPHKNIPRALFSASIIVLIGYTVVGICAVSALPFAELAASESPLAAIAKNESGQTGILIISIIALFATSNTILSNMLGSSRVLLNMAGDSKKFAWLSKVSHKRKTPINALILILAVMYGFALIGDIETIARIANVFIFMTFIVVNLAVIRLRFVDANLERPYRIPFAVGKMPVIPVFGILLTLLLFGYNFYSLLIGQQ